MSKVYCDCEDCQDLSVLGNKIKPLIIKTGWLIRCEKCGQAMNLVKYERLERVLND